MLMSVYMFHLLYLQDQIITTVSFLTLNKFQFQLLSTNILINLNQILFFLLVWHSS